MQLPDSWTEALFAKLTLRYGAAFMRQYADLDSAMVKADWADVLGGFHAKPDAIRYALENLPTDRPPNAMQFRALCNSAKEPAAPALSAPQSKPSPETLARADEIKASQKQIDPKAWAWALKDRESRGPGLTRAQREMWRTALASELQDQGFAA